MIYGPEMGSVTVQTPDALKRHAGSTHATLMATAVAHLQRS